MRLLEYDDYEHDDRAYDNNQCYIVLCVIFQYIFVRVLVAM